MTSIGTMFDRVKLIETREAIQKVYKSLAWQCDNCPDDCYREGIKKAMSLMREEFGLDEDGEWESLKMDYPKLEEAAAGASKAITEKCPQCNGYMKPVSIQGPYSNLKDDLYFIVAWECHDRLKLACESGAITKVR